MKLNLGFSSFIFYTANISVPFSAFLGYHTTYLYVMECIYCANKAIKRGKQNRIQRYRCKHCKRYFQAHYTKRATTQTQWIRRLNNEGCGISNISRLLHIAKSSVQRSILRLAKAIPTPCFTETNQTYEIDELLTFFGNKANGGGYGLFQAGYHLFITDRLDTCVLNHQYNGFLFFDRTVYKNFRCTYPFVFPWSKLPFSVSKKVLPSIIKNNSSSLSCLCKWYFSSNIPISKTEEFTV